MPDKTDCADALKRLPLGDTITDTGNVYFSFFYMGCRWILYDVYAQTEHSVKDYKDTKSQPHHFSYFFHHFPIISDKAKNGNNRAISGSVAATYQLST